MLKVLMFQGDCRQEIADNVSVKYKGLVHNILMEYYEIPNLTLCYVFNEPKSIIRLIFADHIEWLEKYGVWMTKEEYSLYEPLRNNYHLVEISEHSSGLEGAKTYSIMNPDVVYMDSHASYST